MNCFLDVNTTRREFFLGGAAAFAALPVAGETEATSESSPLITSAPVLMNPAERTMDVAFAVNGDANGWVEVSQSPDMAKTVRVYSGGDNPLMTIGSKFAVIRICGLKPATRYWYRIGADRIRWPNDYKMWLVGTETGKKVYSFATLGSGAEGSFCVINDTHSRENVIGMWLEKIAELKPACMVWNGDARNCYRTSADAVATFLKPDPAHPEFAAEVPFMFVNGNHDFRGRFARRMQELVLFRDVRERAPAFAGLGRNFVQRLGDIALIGLDTGEDKQDTNPIMCGTSRMTKYRELQTRWLADEIEKPAVKTAKFKVAFCHIPLFSSNPCANPGDIMPDDADPRYSSPWAGWQRTCANLWGPLFVKAGVQLVVTGHTHRFRYDPPAPGRTWAHIVGGGPDFTPRRSPSYPTVIEGRVEGGALRVTVHDCGNKRIVFDRRFGA